MHEIVGVHYTWQNTVLRSAWWFTQYFYLHSITFVIFVEINSQFLHKQLYLKRKQKHWHKWKNSFACQKEKVNKREHNENKRSHRSREGLFPDGGPEHKGGSLFVTKSGQEWRKHQRLTGTRLRLPQWGIKGLREWKTAGLSSGAIQHHMRLPHIHPKPPHLWFFEKP